MWKFVGQSYSSANREVYSTLNAYITKQSVSNQSCELPLWGSRKTKRAKKQTDKQQQKTPKKTEGNNKEQKSMTIEKNQRTKELILWKDQYNLQTSRKTNKLKKEQKIKITNIRNETGDISTGSADIERVINKGI